KIGGLEACRVIKQRVPSARVIMLTASEDESHLVGAVRAGARGYLLKNSTEEIALGIRGVASGYSLLSPTMTSKLLLSADPGGHRDEPDARTNAGLPAPTPRELEVLQLIAGGRTNHQIASELDISENTVRQHVRNILDKFQVHSRTEAATYAMRRGLINPTDR
ncbi:MAG: LuxR C-terminal-related transcriptional regulator, partial [Marmoricola sp.]